MITELINNWPQHLVELFITIIGTIIGIFGPFYVQSNNEKKNKKKQAIQYLKDIRKELKGVKKQLEAIKDTDIYLSPIKTPLWDSLINTNEVQLLKTLKHKDKTFSSTNLTKQLFQIYDLINEYNLWWNMYTQGAVVGARTQEELTSIITFIENSKKNLLCNDAHRNEYFISINSTLTTIEMALKLF